MNTNRQQDFQQLIARAQACRRCPRMEGRVRVLGPANGPIDAQILFIAEAPGRLGADRSGIPLTGDQSGRNFDALLQHAGLARESIFITNAVLCNPRDERGNNARPTSREIEHCSDHLGETIALLQPRYVITLGQIALQALRHIANHQVTLAQHVGLPQKWNGRWLIALYHSGPRARIHRPLTMQIEDFRHLGAFIRDDQAHISLSQIVLDIQV
jgi:uracil-DNA glycosylase family 4